MANIVVTADFIGQNNLPDKDLIDQNLTAFITKYEPILMTKLLGSALYTLYKATPTGARFVALLPYIKPAIIDYVYWFYLEDQGVQLTSLGASQSKKQNAISVSPYGKMVRAWNEMVQLNKDLHKFFVDNASTYPEYTIVLPSWFFWWGYNEWFWGDWYEGCGVDEIYRLKNRLGI